MPNTYTFNVASGLGFQVGLSAYVSPIRISVQSGLGLSTSLKIQAQLTHQISVSSGLGLSADLASFTHNTTHYIGVSSGLGLQSVVSLQALRTYQISVSSGLGFSAQASLTYNTTHYISVTSGLGFSASIPNFGANHVYQISVASGLGFSVSALAAHTYIISVSSGIGLSATASSTAVRSFSVAAGLGLQAAVSYHREISLSVGSGLGFSAGLTAVGPHYLSIMVGLGLSASVVLNVGGIEVSVGLGLEAVVSCTLEPPNTLGTPGLSPTGGPRIKLLQGISGQYPFTWCETPSGIVLGANGVDPMIRWDSMSQSADFAGVIAPTTAPTLTPSGLGSITGLRICAVRFIDSSGNPSNVSPLGGPVNCGHDQSIDDITLSATTGSVTVAARSHGLTGGTVLLSGILGLPINGQFTITVIDQDHFTLNGVVASGTWQGGGVLVSGSTTITYSNIPQPTQNRVTQVQLLRNLEGETDVLYVDAVLLPGQSTATTSTPDEILAQQPAVTLRSSDGFPLGLRYSPPPSNRPFLCNYMGRVFAAGDTTYYNGCVQVTCGNTIIQGIGTGWTTSFAGRRMYVARAAKSYGIVSLSTSTQQMVIDQPYTDSTQAFATYLLRSSASDRKMLSWSEPDNPEAWPTWNGLSIPEDDDQITGMFRLGPHLFLSENRHLWKFQFVDDPSTTGHLFMTVEGRGCLSQRLIALADNLAFLLDESGIYSFNGDEPKPISQPIQNMFQMDALAPTLQVDWSQDTTLWHASVDPIRTIIRWFVAMVGQTPLTNAICYNYRLDRWWTEQYPVAVTSSCTGTLAEAPNVGIPSGYRRALVGAECRMVLVLGEGALDVVADSGTLRGTVASASPATLTDATASFASYLGGAPVSIVSGTGAGQTRIISSNTSTTLTLVQAWTITPDTTSQYQVGGVSWQWRSGWLDVEDAEAQTARDFLVSFQPTTNPVSFSAQFYYDHATAPIVWAYPYSQDGVTCNEGDPNVYVDMTSSDVVPGWRVFRDAHHTERYAYDDRYVQIYLSGTTNDQVVRVYQVSIRGVDQEGT